jgi:2-polyprenyl-3-methyl-5-hydroxy-6-metoxy-1,4-benzoquinol methylase
MSSEWDRDTARDVALYSTLVKEHGISHRALDWGSAASQRLRFAVLAGIGEISGASVLDVGCGLGDFWLWCQESGKSCDYTGVDVTPAMVDMARQRFNHCRFDVGTAEQYAANSFDYVIASGIFAKRQQDPAGFLRAQVAMMYSKCKKGLAFNSLSAWASGAESDEFAADPLQILQFCHSVARKVAFRHDYLPHDFTVYMYRDDNT